MLYDANVIGRKIIAPPKTLTVEVFASANTGTISHRAMLCARRAKLGQYKSEFRAVEVKYCNDKRRTQRWQRMYLQSLSSCIMS